MTTFLTIQTTDGRSETEALPGPGGLVRFAVGEPGRRSSVWRLWANPNKRDVYLAVRNLAEFQKFSLHESGDWRYQWVGGKHAEAQTARTGTRVIDRWPRPAELGGGWTHASTIWVPEQDVVYVPGDREAAEEVVWFPRPQAGQAVAFHVALARPDHGFVELSGAVPTAAFDLVGGESVLLLVGVSEVGEQNRRWLGDERDRLLTDARRAGVDLASATAARLFLFGYDASGRRMVWDLATVPREAREE
jgi:hypothetical protein